MGKVLKDWFGRRADDAFTYRDNSKKLFNWDKGRDRYSSFFVKEGTPLQESAKLVGSMMRVMNVPKGVELVSTTKGKDLSKSIQIPTGMLLNEDESFKTDDTVLDAFYGKTIQNAALATMQSPSEYAKTVHSLSPTRKNIKVSDVMFGILNTERIDKKLSNRFPGYLKFVQKYKDYQYNEKYEPLDASEHAQKRLMDLVVRMLRYPAEVTEEEMEEFAKPMEQIEKLVKKHGGIPTTSDGCQSMASSLANVVYKYVENPPPEDEDEEEQEGDGDEEGEGGGPGSGMSKGDLNDFAKSMLKDFMSEEGGGGGAEDNLLHDYEKTIEESEEKNEGPMGASENHSEAENVEFIQAHSDKSVYKSVVKSLDMTKAAVLKKLFERKSRDYKFSLKGMRSGRLDTNKIAEAVQGVPTIYERYGEVKTDKICVGVLIDESGSMSSGSKMRKAREAAIFINEIFKKSKDVQLFMYGHTADQGSKNDMTNIRIYREPGKNLDQYALGSLSARANNRDGVAIMATALRIRKFTQDSGILFVISDGQPAASNYSNGVADTKAKVLKAQALGFQVIQIAIDSSVRPEEMFQHYVKMTDVSSLPRELAGYMSTRIDKMIKERVTM